MSTQEILDEAANRLDQRCLRKHGFAYPPVKASPHTAPEDEAGVVDMAKRRSQGYGIFDGGSSQQPVDAFYARLSPSEQSRFDLVLYGPEEKKVKAGTYGLGAVRVPAEGCTADSRRTLAGDVVLWARMDYYPEDVDNRLSDEAASDSGYLAALRTWTSCMAAGGLPYASPGNAEDSLRTAYKATGRTEGFRKREVEVADADGECELRAHLPAAELAARRRLARSLPPKDLRALTDLAAYRNATVDRAHAILDP